MGPAGYPQGKACLAGAGAQARLEFHLLLGRTVARWSHLDPEQQRAQSRRAGGSRGLSQPGMGGHV